MSAKLKLLLIVIVSIFATAATGIYITQRQPSAAVSNVGDEQPQYFTVANQSTTVTNPEREKYKIVPLNSLSSPLQGSDPAELALNAFDGLTSHKGMRKVEVSYPQYNQALVKITQTKRANGFVIVTKYRVEFAPFGRSLLVSSPRVWQIIWAGSQEQCLVESNARKNRPKQVLCQSEELRVKN